MLKKIFYISVLYLMCGVASAAPKVIVEGVRYWQSPESLRVVLDVSSKAQYTLTSASNPERIIIDIPEGYSAVDLAALKMRASWLKGIRQVPSDVKNTLRLEVTLAKEFSNKHFMLTPYQQYGHRIVVDLLPVIAKNYTPSTTPVAVKNVPTIAKKVPVNIEAPVLGKQIVVAIDAGHGGDDPGAIGPNRVREKDITLAIARKLKLLIDAQPNMRGVLIRDGDYFVPLRKRTEIARKHKADLFISIHADGFTDPKAHGASVWVLSTKGAKSEVGRWLETKENNSDLLGGTDSVNLDEKDRTLAGVLLDLSMDYSLKASKDLAQFVLSNLDDHATMHKSSVQDAGFMVLKSPDIPSILVETAFISNPNEEKLLSSSSYQQKLATSIFKGVDHYYQKYLAVNKTIRYIVEHGDTLSGIANRYQVSLSKIRQVNNLASDYLQIGQELLIP